MANLVSLLAIFGVLFRGLSPADAVLPFRDLLLPHFRDAAYGVCSFGISALDCASAVDKAVRSKLWDLTKFDVEAYERDIKLSSGDMTWIVPGRLLAFRGPVLQPREVAGAACRTLSAEEYAKLFNRIGITCVVRLNEQCYDRKKFTHAGLNHVDLIFPDGSVPSDSLLSTFLKICTREIGAVAVHCKAGLGRTGTMIAAFLIHRYKFTAAEAIAWCRLCRPGSIVGAQQHFLVLKEDALTHSEWVAATPRLGKAKKR